MSIGTAPQRHDGRLPGQLRPVTLELGTQKWAEGSCLIRVGDTHVLMREGRGTESGRESHPGGAPGLQIR